MYGKTIGEKISMLFSFVIISMFIYAGTAWAINRIVGSNIVVGPGLVLESVNGDDSIWVGDDSLFKAYFGDEDWGDVTVTTNVVTIDNGVVEAADLKAEDFGDFTVAAGVATLDAGVVGDNEIDYANVTLADFDYQGNWKVFYSDGSGDVTELALGADGTYLMSNGASAAPTFETPGGSGDITDVFDCANGDANQLTIGESEYLIGGAVDGATDPYISLPQGTDVSSVTGEGRISWDTDGDRLYVGDGAAVNWILGEEDIDASSELLAIMDDETGTGVLVFGTSPTFTTGITVPDNSISDEELDEGANFTWTGTQDFTSATVNLGTGAVDAAAEISADVIEESHLKVTGGAAVDEDIFTYEATTGDFEWHTPAELGLISTYTQFWGENDLAISWGTDDLVDVFYPVSEKFGNVTHPYFVRNINAGGASDDDQKDTLVFSGRLPLSFTNDIDSITIGYRTSTTTATTSGIKVIVYAMCDLSGFAPADTVKYTGSQIASASAGVWNWLSVAGASINAIGAGSWIMVLVECEMDFTAQAETVDVERPYFWGVAK